MLSLLRTAAILSLLLFPAARAVGAREGPKTVQVVVGADGETRFVPATITVKQGDTVHFVAFAGVHNVHFTPEANVGVANLPAPSDWLLREGDSYELKVGLAPGTYHFQCDPHAAMGMKGTLTVTE
jgi:plastocyanin